MYQQKVARILGPLKITNHSDWKRVYDTISTHPETLWLAQFARNKDDESIKLVSQQLKTFNIFDWIKLLNEDELSFLLQNLVVTDVEASFQIASDLISSDVDQKLTIYVLNNFPLLDKDLPALAGTALLNNKEKVLNIILLNNESNVVELSSSLVGHVTKDTLSVLSMYDMTLVFNNPERNINYLLSALKTDNLDFIQYFIDKDDKVLRDPKVLKFAVNNGMTSVFYMLKRYMHPDKKNKLMKLAEDLEFFLIADSIHGSPRRRNYTMNKNEHLSNPLSYAAHGYTDALIKYLIDNPNYDPAMGNNRLIKLAFNNGFMETAQYLHLIPRVRDTL